MAPRVEVESLLADRRAGEHERTEGAIESAPYDVFAHALLAFRLCVVGGRGAVAQREDRTESDLVGIPRRTVQETIEEPYVHA